MPRRLIDIHNHPNWHGVDTDALVANMDEHGIEKTWLLSWDIPPQEMLDYPLYNEVLDPRAGTIPLWMVIEGLQRHPDRFIGGWAPDPRERTARQRLQAAVRIHGIKVYGECKFRMRYDSPDAIATFRYCAELGLPVLFHLECPPCTVRKLQEGPEQWPEWYGGDISVVDAMCRECPDTQFIGHGPGFWRNISGDADSVDETYPAGPIAPGGQVPELMRRHGNLHCDLSAGSGSNAITRDPAFAREFVVEFQDRIMHGRDYFDDAQIKALNALDLPDDVLDKVFWQNAERLVG